TLRQMYTGSSDWSELQKVAKLRDEHQQDSAQQTLVLGSGDVKTYADACMRCSEYGLDGALIGRGSFGKPWVFSADGYSPKLEEVFEICLEHARLHERFKDSRAFVQMRKNLAWYIS